jgi:4'-phosphopantetheinyl transferase
MIDNVIFLFLGSLAAVDTPDVRRACFDALSPSEVHRANRFLLESHRQQFLLAHGLLRFALSHLAPSVKPAAWCFREGRYGRPCIAEPLEMEGMHFSLSHTDGYIACAVSTCESVGVDVEDTRRQVSSLELARRYFSPEEVRDLHKVPVIEQTARFFDYWTLKEAYIKARGMGLHIRLDSFSMLIGSGQQIRIAFSPGFEDDPGRWHFTQWSPSAHHRLAVADGSGVAREMSIQPWPLPERGTRG